MSADGTAMGVAIAAGAAGAAAEADEVAVGEAMRDAGGAPVTAVDGPVSRPAASTPLPWPAGRLVGEPQAARASVTAAPTISKAWRGGGGGGGGGGEAGGGGEGLSLDGAGPAEGGGGRRTAGRRRHARSEHRPVQRHQRGMPWRVTQARGLPPQPQHPCDGEPTNDGRADPHEGDPVRGFEAPIAQHGHL